MRFSSSLMTVLFLPVLLGGCQSFTSPSASDHRIKVFKSGAKTVAIPPECASWHEGWGTPFANDPWPSYGCSQARNLAAQVEDPGDLIEGDPMTPPEAVSTTAAISRYQSGQTTRLIDPNKETPEEIKKMEDNRVGGAPKR